MESKNIHYVYVYLDPRKSGTFTYGQYTFNNEPFYVGKSGKKNRYLEHLSESYNYRDKNLFRKGNIHKCNVIRKIKHELNQNPIIVKYKENLTEKESFDLEIDMIKTIGRYDLGKGPLTNKTDGGDGGDGYKHTEKFKIKASQRMMGENNPNFGKHISHMSNKQRKEYSERMMGENNPMKRKEVKEKASRNHANVSGKNNPFYRKHHSKEIIKIIKEKRALQIFTKTIN